MLFLLVHLSHATDTETEFGVSKSRVLTTTGEVARACDAIFQNASIAYLDPQQAQAMARLCGAVDSWSDPPTPKTLSAYQACPLGGISGSDDFRYHSGQKGVFSYEADHPARLTWSLTLAGKELQHSTEPEFSWTFAQPGTYELSVQASHQ